MEKPGTADDNVCAIFVHAGAGFHSRDNETNHLRVCELALEAGMSFLRHGGTAVSAVEMALMVLEDAPITNAGLGSNLNEKGIIECDASIVDHFGRSGAAGAVPNVKNPIHLARRIYEKSFRSPGMSRVPPNFLCGEGATDFAWDNNVVVVPNDVLISPVAGERYKNWVADIKGWQRDHPPSEEEIKAQSIRHPIPIAPGHPDIMEKVMAARQLFGDRVEERERSQTHDGKDSDDARNVRSNGTPASQGVKSKSSGSSQGATPSDSASSNRKPRLDGDDWITDTVGAIAVDKYGNIAAGSSSGGIGMKHRGRIGPAALIGIGTHVIPVDPTDPNETTVAVVCSGTGEHIATTFAASTCATRVYYNHKKSHAGFFEKVNEEEAIAAMLKDEFAGHPSVVNSDIDSSIGLMAVKQTRQGIALIFAHNTDSFALGAFSNKDSKAQCLMSRNKNKSPVAQGGIMIRK
ncbi:hypothetical protein N7454_002714 [Penicillium verhagenii]|nr:hypothetical protein N7454_002714 [Penicillium verhagenii]